ncbi:transglutaminase family protein [Roseomonas haemaphysalidis]|uniref:Transglutaminase family protein n=1 Tax=Roseomonas haemaphysalidis TaxID=2768162 RepID=A0ABS3KKY3_9PROT|nr:transglutaminase family protein [Roseomonas haemaphysalidis]MBO1078130.1 transglutaminase family protein [Roseomonas haemaphysalidis]
MQWRVRHVTTYRYAETVDLANHLLHLLPRALPCQQVLAATLSCTPPAALRTDALDHFGNRVTRLSIDRPHDRFEVVAEALVRRAAAPPPAAGATPPWEAVAACPTPAAAEFAFPSPMLPEHAEARGYAALSFPPGRPVLEGLRDLNSRIRRDFRYRPGETGVTTPVSEVLARRAGVCQDFAQLMITGLRGLGLPARYVSGYIRTHPAPGSMALRGADQSHAWVGCWLGEADGWVDLDPTNDLVAGEEHVVLGWGRDFADVSPLRGIILGGGRHRLEVAVDLAAA